jgi:hypothetical protein
MTKSTKRLREFLWPQFSENDEEHLNPYYTFQNYRETWGMTIFILMTTALSTAARHGLYLLPAH